MMQSFSSFRSRRVLALAAFAVVGAVALALVAGPRLVAQVDGERGIPAIASSTDIEVGNVEVNVQGKNAEEAREKGWREAQRKAWAKIGGPGLSDGQLQTLVSSVVIEQEQIGPRRYIASLGVIFDRGRATRYLGRGGTRLPSSPLLLVPVTFEGGTELVYEQRNPWQRAWASFQAGGSRIAYVRPSGAGGDSLLMTYGQVGRRSRSWWRNVLDEFEASDVIIAIARLDHAYPGGPITGNFTARYGPDNTLLESFEMSTPNPQGLRLMLAKAVVRMDAIYQKALADGKLKPNTSLNLGEGSIDPAIQRLIEMGKQAEAKERADKAAAAAAEREKNKPKPKPSASASAQPTPTATPTEAAPAVSAITVQFASPDAGTIDATLAAVRATPGVRGAATTSFAVGGTSVMSVSYAGDIEALAKALRSRGFSVNFIGNSLSIRR